MHEGHNLYLVALSVLIAILSGYTGFGLAARIRGGAGTGRRTLLAGAAGFLAVGIWTMHFTGMLAAPIPPGAAYLVLPTIVSFLICALVVGVSLFFVSIGEASHGRVIASAVLLGLGIVSMHYVGIDALTGNFAIRHEPAVVALSILIAIGTGYGGLRAFLARHGGARLALSAIAFGIAVSGMHYTAMHGMHFEPAPGGAPPPAGLAASPDILAPIVALLCFLIAAGFLLFLVPEPRRRPLRAAASRAADPVEDDPPITLAGDGAQDGAAVAGPRLKSAPLGGIGQSRPIPVARLPVHGADGVHFIEASEIRGVKADAHYTLVHDGSRERMCPWSISQVEEHLNPALFVRVHRSHIVALPHVTLVRREGDGAVVELDGPVPHRVPVSRARIAALRARLGLATRRPAAR